MSRNSRAARNAYERSWYHISRDESLALSLLCHDALGVVATLVQQAYVDAGSQRGLQNDLFRVDASILETHLVAKVPAVAVSGNHTFETRFGPLKVSAGIVIENIFQTPVRY